MQLIMHNYLQKMINFAISHNLLFYYLETAALSHSIPIPVLKKMLSTIMQDIYSFIMFGCFSKKKRQKPTSAGLDKVSTEPTTPQQSNEESISGPFLLPPPKTIKKSKFCPIEPADLRSPQSKSINSLMAIDRMLEEELKEEELKEEKKRVCVVGTGEERESSLPYAQENTAHFGQLSEQPATSRFTNISPSGVQPNQTLQNFNMAFRDTKSLCFQMQDCNEEEQHMIPKASLEEIHTIEELAERISSGKVKRRSKKNSSRTSRTSHSSFLRDLKEEETAREFTGYDATVEQWALDTTITLQNFKISPQRVQQKADEEDSLLEETLEEAENSFYSTGTLQDQFTRATVSADSPSLSKRIFTKMTQQEKNAPNFKGYTPVQLLVLKTIRNEAFLELTKAIIYDPEVALDCRGPTGWTPIQQALFYRSIPLVTHLFKASYNKKQQQYQSALTRLATLLQQVPDFALEMEVKVDSFLPLLGSLTPSDTLYLRKQGSSLRLKYSLVGYEFPNCKRRDMEILFSGGTLWGVNLSKGTYCDLLQGLQHEEMILMIEDMLTGEMSRGWPIVHSASLQKALSLFQNDITASLAGTLATKHSLNLCYSSTAEKRRSQVTSPEDLAFLGNYAQFKDRRDSLTIKEKNRNKRVQLEVWLAGGFGLQLPHLVEMLGVLSMGNSFIAEWSKFFKQEVGSLLQQSGLFPVKIDIPLSFSLFFNIEFKAYTPLPQAPEILLPPNIIKVSRKEFQGTLLSKEKRSLFIQAYT